VVSGQSEVKVVYSVSRALLAVVEAPVALTLTDGVTDAELESELKARAWVVLALADACTDTELVDELVERPVASTATELAVVPLYPVELVMGAECVWVTMYVEPLVVSGQRLVNVVKLVSSAVAERNRL